MFEKRFLEGSKKARGKKVVESKNVFYKSCRKFYTLGGDFFSFWRFKNEDSRAKKRFSDFAYIIRVFSHGAPQYIFFQKKITGIIYWPIEMI